MLTLQEVIKDIEESKKMRDIAGMMTGINKEIFKQITDGHFEAVLNGNRDEKCLIPEEGFPFYLYRGQNEEVIPCVPSLYRGNPSDIDIFINKMKLVAFKHLLESYPIVNGFFKKNHFAVDIEGLAQHYGLKTSVLDLTRSLDVAIFFAVCKYNSATGKYECFEDNDTHTAILYVFDPIFDNETIPYNNHEIYNGNIRPIGLQPFRRPAEQKGFSLHIDKGDSVRCSMYKFQFTSEDSKHYFEMFDKGGKLWIQDRLVDKAKQISELKEFPFKIFHEACTYYKPKGYSKTRLMHELRGKGIFFGRRIKSVIFSDEERNEIIEEWNNGEGKKFADSIIRRSSFDYEGEDKDGRMIGIKNKKEFRNLHMLTLIYTLIILARPDLPIGSVWVNYTNTPASEPKSKGHWEKVPAHSSDVFGETYLTEDDWKI